tara:strand:- start:1010 stop:1426 length:417 start_codon:yes stop_codon:yes gene_type:complete
MGKLSLRASICALVASAMVMGCDQQFQDNDNTTLLDLDNDGNTDRVTMLETSTIGNNPYEVRVQWGVIGESYGDHESVQTFGRVPHVLTFADISGNGNLDLVWAIDYFEGDEAIISYRVNKGDREWGRIEQIGASYSK